MDIRSNNDDLKKSIIELLSRNRYGLTIEDVARSLNINRATASKYLLALEAEKFIVSRNVGAAKLHYSRGVWIYKT